MYLFLEESLLMVYFRPSEVHVTRYVVGDASAEGLPVVTQYPDLGLDLWDGLWDKTFAEEGYKLARG